MQSSVLKPEVSEAKALSIEVYVDASHLGPDLHTEEREDCEGPSQELYGRYHGRVPVACNTTIGRAQRGPALIGRELYNVACTSNLMP